MLTPSNIMYAIGLISVIFSIYLHFRRPQEDLEKRQAVSEREVDGKAALLAQQLQWEKEANEKKFGEFQSRLDQSIAMAQNHIHSVSVEVNSLTLIVNSLGNKVTELSTIINERIPNKNI